MKKNAVQVTLLLIALVLCRTVHAKTVALWPIEYNQTSGIMDGRCTIDARNDLSFYNIGIMDGRCTIDARNDLSFYNIASKDVVRSTWGIGWTLPPNPDTTANPLCSPYNATYVCATTNKANFLANGSVGRYLAVNRSFTLEGFLRLKSLPESGNCGRRNRQPYPADLAKQPRRLHFDRIPRCRNMVLVADRQWRTYEQWG